MNWLRFVHLRLRGIIIPQTPHLPLTRLLPPDNCKHTKLRICTVASWSLAL